MNSNVKSTLGNSTSTSLGSSFTTAKNAAVNALNTVKNVAVNAVNATKNVASNAANSLSNTASNASNSMKDVFSSESFSSVTEPIKESLNASMENETSPFFTVPIMIALGVLVVIFILFVVFRDQIVFAFTVVKEKISGTTTPSPPSPVMPDGSMIDSAAINKMMPSKKEVFNIAADKYTYTDAEPLCKAFGAELATYDQVKEAWNKGADWCNYGWVKGQAAVFPTQQTTYDKLQAGPESQRMSCGIPGVNGGYFDNPELRFGVNCYGNRRTENETDIRYETEKQHNLTPDALEYDKKVQNYKVQMDQIPVNPFKPGAWTA